MRKFRVWDNLRKKFYEIEDDWVYIFIDKNGCVRFFMDDDGGKIGIYQHELNEIESLKERYLINYSTGLWDKDGRDIFEGDVCKYCDDPLIVEWINKEARFLLKTTKTYLNYLLFDSEIEIIGNIYKHPYLLEKKLLIPESPESHVHQY